MLFLVITLVLGTLIILLIFTTYATHFYRDFIGLPPGPVPLPIIGNLHQLGVNAHENLRLLSKKHGPVMRILIGSEIIIAVCGTDEVLEGLVTKSVDFAGRPLTYTLSLTSSGGKGIAFADYSPRWKFFRKISHSSMKMFGNGIATIENLVITQNKLLHKRLDEQLNVPVDLHYQLGLTVLNVVCAMIFGHQYNIDDEDFVKLEKSTTLFVRGFEYDSFIDVFPILRYLPNKRIKTLKYALSLRNPIVRQHLENHKRDFEKDKDKNKDLCHNLLRALYESVQEGGVEKEYLSDECLIAILDDMLGAGSETTLTVIRWSVVYLVLHQEIQKKCFQEINEVLGEEQILLKHKPDLPYCDAFIHETLRMSSIAPMAVPHKTTKNTSVGGYAIPKNTQVIFNLYALHRSEDDWKSPFDFNPNRFINGDKLHPPGHHRAYHPFSAGRRICLAEALAKMELFLVITNLIQNFKFLPDPENLPNMIGVPGLFLGPKQHKVIVQRRKKTHMNGTLRGGE